jgi:hypothetical protein
LITEAERAETLPHKTVETTRPYNPEYNRPSEREPRTGGMKFLSPQPAIPRNQVICPEIMVLRPRARTQIRAPNIKTAFSRRRKVLPIAYLKATANVVEGRVKTAMIEIRIVEYIKTCLVPRRYG